MKEFDLARLDVLVQVVLTSGAEVVDDPDGRATLHERFREVRTDERSSPGHQDRTSTPEHLSIPPCALVFRKSVADDHYGSKAANVPILRYAGRRSGLVAELDTTRWSLGDPG